MKTLISMLWRPRLAAGIVAASLTLGQSQAEAYRAHAADCQEAANRFSGPIKDQYEKLARQWLELAERVASQVVV